MSSSELQPLLPSDEDSDVGTLPVDHQWRCARYAFPELLTPETDEAPTDLAEVLRQLRAEDVVNSPAAINDRKARYPALFSMTWKETR